jgi:putative toxin-antitoxin system antitoxin component (TIGR02293 family)
MIVTYVVKEMGMEQTDVSSILGGRKVFREGIAGRMELINLSSKGVSKEVLLRLAKYLDLSLGQMAAMLPVTERTIQRYQRGQRFNKVVSEQILQIAEVAARGSEVFGSREEFLSWLNSPSQALGNRTPASLLSSRFGNEAVSDELGRIEHGVLS